MEKRIVGLHHETSDRNRLNPSTTRRTFLTRGGASALGLTVIPSLLAACGGGQQASLDRITWAQTEGPPDLNPLRRFDVEGAMVLSLALENLVRFDENFEIQPNLAQDGERVSPTEYVYRLRRGIEFSDGKPLTVDDVVYSLRSHLTNPQSAFGFFYGNVADIRAGGATDIRFRLKSPDTLFPYALAHTGGLVYQKAAAAKAPRALGTPKNLPVGTGPYVLEQYSQGDRTTLSRNESYRGAKPRAKTVVLPAIPDDSARLLSMRSGELSGTYDVPLSDFTQWKGLNGTKVADAAGLGVAYLVFNVARPPFNDVRVRRAFAYALDRKGLVSAAIDGAGDVATAFTPPRFWTAVQMDAQAVRDAYATFPQYEFDPEKAKSEIESSSARGGFTLKVAYPSAVARLGKVLLSLKENLGPAGVNLQVSEISIAAWDARLFENRSKMGLEVVLYRPDYPDPANYASFFASDQIKEGNNFGSYRNAKVDALLAAQRAEQDPRRRADALMEVNKIVATDLPVAPVWWEGATVATKSSIAATPSPIYYLQSWAAGIKPA